MSGVITLTYRIETAGSVEQLAAKIASDQSTGTFVAVPGETEELKARVAARVTAIRMLEPAATPSFPDVGPGPFHRPFRCSRAGRSVRACRRRFPAHHPG